MRKVYRCPLCGRFRIRRRTTPESGAEITRRVCCPMRRKVEAAIATDKARREAADG